jgi:small nuclear ribonucleoprotein (snRNP)-like protein
MSHIKIEFVEGHPYLPGATSLLNDLDKKVLLVLRDGRHLVGVLRSFDQYLNLILEEAYERVLLPGNISASKFLLNAFQASFATYI